ncbi:MAG: hypothetical protein ACI4C1_09760 [Lachnospiraceae bacterium]
MSKNMISLALSEENWAPTEQAIFPFDIFMIDGLKSFHDFEHIYAHAFEQLQPYQGYDLNLYISGGLSTEVLEVLKVAVELDITCYLYYFDKQTGEYLTQAQKVTWKPHARTDESEPILLCVCENRHAMLEGLPSVLKEKNSEQLFDWNAMEEEAYETLKPYATRTLKLYLTGLTQAYISVLNAAARLEMPVIVEIYDKNQSNYLDLNMDMKQII